MTKAYYAQIISSDGLILNTGYINDANGRFHADGGERYSRDQELIPTDIPEGAYLDGILDIKGETATEATRGVTATIAQRFGWPVHEKFPTHEQEMTE